MPKLTERTIKAATPPEKGTRTLWDDSLKGFGIRVSQGGTKTFIVLIASGRRQKIGRYPLVSLAEARATAKVVLAEKTLGKLRPTHMAFDDAKADFLAECAKKNRPKTVLDYTRLLKTHFPFGRKNVGDITPREVVKRLNAIVDKPSEKHHAFVAGRVFFNWCATQHIIDHSPMERIAVPPLPRARDRVLTPDELKAVYETALSGTTPYHRIVALIALTGQRRGEIAALQWLWIKDRHIYFPLGTTKNKQQHILPFHETVGSILEACPQIDGSPYVFPASRTMTKRTTIFNGWSKAKVDFDKECGVADWTLHDLRRTFATNLAEMGVHQTVTEKILNHVSGASQSPISRVYNRYHYLPEMSDALLRWERHLNTLVEPRG